MVDTSVSHPRRIAAAPFVIVLALVASACLAPTQFDPTGRAPVGNLEVVTDAAGGIRVSGWALEPETSAPVTVKVGVAGVVRQVTADRARPDVAAAYPGKGPNHGFDYTFGPLAPGLRGICVWVDNAIGAGDDRLLGCDNIIVTDGSPVGHLDTAEASAAREVTASGWVFDPNSSGPAEIVVNIDGQLADRVKADQHRPDVGAVHGRPYSGFHTKVAATPGSHQVCVAVFNVGFGEHRLLGCRTVIVAESTQDRRPSGYLTEVTPTGAGSVHLRGVAQDPDGAAGLKVRLDVDPGTSGAWSVTLDVAGGVFATDVSGLSPGLHTLCPVGLDVNGGFGVTGDREFTCGSTVVGNLAVGTGGLGLGPTWVAPPPGTPLHMMSRDAGVSAQLSDGSTMWFFGDTLETNNVGDLLYFKNNTAAWASPNAPTVTRDGVNTGATRAEPWQFASPPVNFCTGSGYPKPALWPESAVAVLQSNGTDRILVFMSKVCLGNSFLEIEAKGMALVEVTYDPLNKPVDTQITGTVTVQDLFGPAHPYGRAAVLGPDGNMIYTYECGQFDAANWALPRPCTVGRVAFAARTDPGAWSYWAGSVGDDFNDASKWTSNSAVASAIQSPTGAEVAAPVAAFTLTRDAVHDAYLMVYSPFPGFTDRVVVRVAETPVGPFTDPVTVFLPGCNEYTGGVHFLCYAGTAQPSLSQPGLLGIGYFDQLITPSPKRGQYMAVNVPFTVFLTATP
jgi:hypothetical protein